MLWVYILVLAQLFLAAALLTYWLATAPAGAPAIRGPLGSRAPTASAAPSRSPTFVVPVVVAYPSLRAVRGDFAARETPEAVCEEGARERYGCESVSALVSTGALPMRRRARAMRGAMVSIGSHAQNHIVAHDVADLWTQAVDLELHEEVWTGADAAGGAGDERCEDWTSVQGHGIYGRRTLVDGDASCADSKRILCVCMGKL